MAGKKGFFGPLIRWLLSCFRGVGRVKGKAPTARLITVGNSHFCEKARWVLDMSGTPYVEDAHMPLIHSHFTAEATQGGSTSVPVLVLGEGKVITDSSEIADHIAAAHPSLELYPPEQREAIKAFEEACNTTMAVAIRRMFYAVYCDNLWTQSLLARLYFGQNSIIENILLPITMFFFSRLIKRGGMVVSRVGEYQRDIERVLDDVEQRLSDGRSYLFGERMTAADICFASMAALLVRPTELQTIIGTDAIVPSTYKKLVDHYRSRRAGQFILRMYSEHRLSEGVKAAPFRQDPANKILGLRF